jgi:type I restriction enzyme S subunit
MTTIRRLDTVCDLTMGQAPEGESYNSEGVGLPLIAGAGDFGAVHPDAKKFTTSPGKVCRTGDIVLGIRATIGEKVVADREYCLGRGVAGLRTKPGLETRYLWHWLTHVSPTLVSKARGATFKQVNRDDIGGLAINLPSLPEQQRIADILDRAETLRAKRRAALAQLDILTQAIFLEMFGDPATNPRDWLMENLETFFHFRTGKLDSNAAVSDGQFPFFTCSREDLKMVIIP